MRDDTLPDPQNDPVPVVETPPDPQAYQGLGDQIPTSRTEAIKSTAEQAYDSWLTWTPGKVLQLNHLNQTGPKVEPSALNDEFFTGGQLFTEPATRAYAEEVQRRALQNYTRESIITRGPQDILDKGLRGAEGLAIGIADPLNLAAGMLMGGVLGAGAKLAGLGADSFLLTERPTFMQAFGRDLVHGAAGALPLEAAHAYQAHQELQDYDSMNFLGNVAANSFMYAGAAGTARYLWPKVTAFLRSRGGDYDTAAERAAISQLEQGKQVSIDGISEQALNELIPGREGSPPPPPDDPAHVYEHSYTPLTEREQIQGKSFYAGTPDAMATAPEPGRPIDQAMGHGLYLTDHPLVANGMAAHALTSSDGRVFKVELDGNTNLIDLEKRLSGPVRDIVEPVLEKAIGKRAGIMLDTADGKQVYDEIGRQIQQGKLPESTYDDMNKALKEQGFDGIRYQGGAFMGEEGQPHNVAMLFDPEKTGAGNALVSASEAIQPDRQSVPKPSLGTYQAAAEGRLSPKSDLLYDDKAFQSLQDEIKNPVQPLDMPSQEKFHTEALEQLQGLHAQGLLDPELAKEMDALKDMADEAKKDWIASKAAMVCVGKDA